MPSPFNRAWRACLRKEWRSEIRNPQGLYLSFLFGAMAMASIMFVTGTQRPTAEMAGGLFTIVILFSALQAVPRLFLAEEEQGTFDLVRQWGSLDALWLGKALFAGLQQLITALVLGVLFAGIIPLPIVSSIHYWITIPLLGLAVANVPSLTSSIVITAQNRWILSTVIALPLLFPFIFLGISALRVSFGVGSLKGGWQAIVALLMYGIAPLAIGPNLARTLWNERKDPIQAPTGQHNEVKP